MRTTLAVLLSLLLLSCGTQDGPGPEPDEPDRVSVWPDGTRRTTELAGEEIAEVTDGPWTVRRVARRGGAAAGEDGAVPRPMESLGDGGGSGPSGAPSEGFGGAPGGRADDPAAPAKGAPSPDSESVDRGAEPEMSGGRREERQGSSPLTAGATDDNEDFEEFLAFLAKWSDREDTVGSYDMLDVSDRRMIRVVNREGKPVPAATVRVVDEAADRIVFTGRTYGDGRVPFYPNVALADGTVVAAAEGAGSGLLVEVRANDEWSRVRWTMDTDELTVSVEAPDPVTDPIRLDVLFLIDTTGSMGDEIDRIRKSLLGVTEKLRSLDREFDLHYAAVLYRDVTDAYVTKSHPFTDDIVAFDRALQSVHADGGGDYAESLNQGLAEAVGREDWRPDAAKVMFLIADAPAHMDYQGDVRYGETVKAAVARGIRIHSVAASGLRPLGTFMFRQIAQFTRGKFIFIRYGTMEATAESHGVTGTVKSNNLDDILFTQIREEVANWGR